MCPQRNENNDDEVLALNLKNLLIYWAASELDALRCANALGKHWVQRSNRTFDQDQTAHIYQRVEEFSEQAARVPKPTAAALSQ